METAVRRRGAEALIVVDYQKSFGKPGESLYVQGGEILVPTINQLMQETEARSGIIIATRDWHPEKTVHFDAWPVHCIAGTPGAEYVEGFEREIVDVEIFKGFRNSNDGYSGFEGVTKVVGSPEKGFEVDPTADTIQAVLRKYGVKVIKIVGLATDYCVKATAIDAIKAGYQVEVISTGIRAVNIAEGDGDRAIEEMKNAGVKIS